VSANTVYNTVIAWFIQMQVFTLSDKSSDQANRLGLWVCL